MSTLVCFHAHPDDESIGTAGLMALAAAAGHRVVLVTATRGELGEIMPGVLEEGEQLGLRRSAELWASAEVLGVARVEVLGYVDSGMMGEATNDAPWCFWQADVDAAARRLATILDEERPDAFTIYDDHGGYGHPDHIQVHRVGLRAAELARTPKVLQGTMNQDHIRRLGEMVRELADDADDVPPEEEQIFGKPEAMITHAVDVSDLLEVKRASMRAHASQIGDDSWFLTMDDESFALAFGTEWYIEVGRSRAPGEPFLPGIFADTGRVAGPA